MEEDTTLVTREQYIEMLIDASFRDASEIETGFMAWCEQHVPIWRSLGHDEKWIRQRIEPEDSTTPYVPVTIDGPQDHDVYYAREYP